MSTTYQNEINTVLTFLRSTNCNLATLENRINYLKKNINSEDFYKIINGTEEKTLGDFNYKIVNINNNQNWCLKSQVEYEIFVKKNNRYNPIYQKLKTVNI